MLDAPKSCSKKFFVAVVHKLWKKNFDKVLSLVAQNESTQRKHKNFTI